MSDNLNQKTVRARSADLMTIPQLQAAKKVIKSKLESNKNDLVIREKLEDMLFDYEKKEKQINSFYSRCMKHKNPRVVGLVQGKRNFLRIVDIKRVSKDGKISDINVKTKGDRPDYGVGSFLHDINASKMAVGIGIASMSVGLANMQFGGASLMDLLKKALRKIFSSNPLAATLITGGVALIAGTKIATNINKNIRRIKQHMAKSAAVQNEIFDELNKEDRLDPYNLGKENFAQSKEQIVQSLFNSPELLHVYEHALRNPQEHGLNATQRLNLMAAMKEAYSKIDDFKREMRGEPTKAEIAEMQNQKENDVSIETQVKTDIAEVKDLTGKISKSSSTQEISSIQTKINNIESAISSIKDEKIKTTLTSELAPIKIEYEKKSKQISSEKAAETKTIVTEIENEITAINSKINVVNKDTKLSDIEQIGNDISSIEKKIESLEAGAEKSKLQSSINSTKKSFEGKKASFSTSTVENSSDKEGEAKGDDYATGLERDQEAFEQIQENIKKSNQKIETMNEENYNSIDVDTEINGLRIDVSRSISNPEIQSKLLIEIDELETKYKKAFSKIEDRIEAKKSERTEVEKLFVEMGEITSKIKSGKVEGFDNFDAALVSLRGDIDALKPRIEAVSNLEDKAHLLRNHMYLEREHKAMYNEVHVISIINEVVLKLKTMSLSNYMVLGKKLESIESKIYNMKNMSIVRKFEFAEKKYIEKRAQLKGQSSTKPFDEINKKFNTLRISIENIKSKTIEADSAKIQSQILEIERDIELLPSEKAHFKEKLEVAKEKFNKAKNNAAVFEAQKNKDLSLSASLTKYERTFLQLNESNYGHSIKSIEEQEDKIDLMMVEIEKNGNDTSNHYRVMYDSLKQGYRAKRKSVEGKINENNNRLIADIQELEGKTLKYIDSMNEYNYTRNSRMIQYNIEKIGFKIESVKNVIDHTGFDSGLSTKLLGKLNELHEKADAKRNEYRMEAEKVEDREKLISDIKNEIADIIKVINNDAVIVSDNHGLDQQMQKLKEIVEKIGDEVLMGEFETAEGIYKKKKEKEEKERSNNTQEINELSTAFEDFRVHMEGFKNMHSFDNVKENIKTKDLLEKMLLDIKAKIEKLPKDSDHRRYYESRYQKEKTFYKNRVIGFEVIEAVNNKMNSLHTNICGLPSDASKFTNAQLVEQFGPVKGMIASVRKDLPMINASLRAEIEETLSKYEEQFKEKESKVEPKLVESDKESEKLYNDKLNRIKELEEGLNESNYLVSKKEYDIITREFKGIPFYNREIEKNLTKLRDKVGKSFTSKLKIIEASATKESSVGNTPEHEIVSQCIDSSVKQIEDEIRKLNAKDFVEGDVEQIKNMISELENWNFDIRGVQIIKVDSKDFDGLKQQVTERVSSLRKSLKEQLEVIGHGKQDASINHEIDVNIRQQVYNLKSLVFSLTPNNFTKRHDSIENSIESLRERLVKEANISEPEKQKLLQELDEIDKKFENYHDEMIVMPARIDEANEKMDNFEKFVDVLSIDSMEDLLEIAKDDFAEIERKVNGINDSTLKERMKGLKTKFNNKQAAIKNEQELSSKNAQAYGVYSKSKTVDTGNLTGDARKEELYAKKMQFGLMDYSRSKSLSMADNELARRYLQSISILRRYIVQNHAKEGMNAVIAEGMFNKETCEFVIANGYSYINPDRDPELKSLIDQCKKLFTASKNVHKESIDVDRGIISANVSSARTQLVVQISKRLNISKEEAGKLISNRGDLIGKASVDAILNDPQIKNLVSKLKENTNRLNGYDSLSESDRTALGHKIREEVLQDISKTYKNALSNIGKEKADAIFVSACKAQGRDPKEVASMLNLTGINFEAKLESKSPEKEPEKIETPEVHKTQTLEAHQERIDKKLDYVETQKGDTERYTKVYAGIQKAIDRAEAEYGKGCIKPETIERYKNLAPEKVLENAEKTGLSDVAGSEASSGQKNLEKIENTGSTTKKTIEQYTAEITQKYKELREAKAARNSKDPETPEEQRLQEEINSLRKSMAKDHGVMEAENAYKNAKQSYRASLSVSSKDEGIKRGRIQIIEKDIDKLLDNYYKTKAKLALAEEKKKKAEKENTTLHADYAKDLEELPQLLESVSKELDERLENIKLIDEGKYEELKSKVEASKERQVTRDDIYPKTQTLEEHEKRINGKLDYLESITDPEKYEQVYRGVQKAIDRAEDEYGEGSISEATKNRYKSLNKEKEKDIFGPKEQQEVLEDVNQLLGEYRLKLQSNSSNAQDVKNQIKELLDTVNDYYTAPESKQQVKEFISNAKKEVSIVEIECATRFTKFDKNAPQEEKVSVEECKNKITALRDEYRNIAEEYAPNKTFSDTRAEAIRDKLNGYFNYLDQVYGAENLAQLKEEINAEIPLTKTSKVESKTKEQSVESGKVSDLKIMFSGLRMTPEFATFIEHYNRLYMTSQASQKTPNSSAVVTFQQMCSKLAGKGYGLDNRQKEVAFRLIEIAKIADTAAVESVKTSGSTKKGPDREKQEKTVALEKRILEMFENGLTEEDIVKVVGDNHKKLVSELSKAAKTMSKS